MSHSLDPLPYYKWHWLRWRASRKVQRMSILERGIYHELLDEQWAEGCVFETSLSDILGDSKAILASAKQVLTICFTEISSGVWQNETLEEQRTELDTIRSKRKIAGVLGGKAKVESVASAKQVLASASKCHIEEKRREEKSIEENSQILLPEAMKISEPTVFDLPLVDGSAFGVPQSLYSEYTMAYPAISVMAELEKMRAWTVSNPKNRKTRNGIARFMNAWLSKAQDKAPTNGNGKAHAHTGLNDIDHTKGLILGPDGNYRF